MGFFEKCPIIYKNLSTLSLDILYTTTFFFFNVIASKLLGLEFLAFIDIHLLCMFM